PTPFFSLSTSLPRAPFSLAYWASLCSTCVVCLCTCVSVSLSALLRLSGTRTRDAVLTHSGCVGAALSVCSTRSFVFPPDRALRHRSAVTHSTASPHPPHHHHWCLFHTHTHTPPSPPPSLPPSSLLPCPPSSALVGTRIQW
ncbi:hypothetical protein Q4I32_003871, partial [Leishmania shawi]